MNKSANIFEQSERKLLTHGNMGAGELHWLRRILLAPLLVELSAVRLTEGSPDLVYCQLVKEKAG